MIGSSEGVAQFVRKNLRHFPVDRFAVIRSQGGLVPVNCGFKPPCFCLSISFLFRILEIAARKQGSDTKNNRNGNRPIYVQILSSRGDFPN